MCFTHSIDKSDHVWSRDRSWWSLQMQCTGLSPHRTAQSETQSETRVKSRHIETQGEAQACTAPQEFKCDSICECELCELGNLRR